MIHLNNQPLYCLQPHRIKHNSKKFHLYLIETYLLRYVSIFVQCA